MKLKGLAVFSIALMALFAAPQAASDVREFVSGVERHLDIAFLHAILKSHESKTVPAPTYLRGAGETEPAAVCANSEPRSREMKRPRPTVRAIARKEVAEIDFTASQMPDLPVTWESAVDAAPVSVVMASAGDLESDVVTFRFDKDIPVAARLNLRKVLSAQEWTEFAKGAKDLQKLKLPKDFPVKFAPQIKVTGPEPHLPVVRPVIPPPPAPARAIACAEIAALEELGE